MLVSRGSMRHRKSASWSAMPPPTSTSASSSTRIDHSCQSAILGIESNDYADEENSDKNLTDMSASSSTSVCSSATDNVQGIDKHWKPKRSVEESATACSGLSSLLKHKASPFPLPSIFCISHSALSSENAESTDIVPFVYPETIPIERISMLASTLESLLRIVDQELLLVDTEPCTADAMQPPPCCVVGLGAFKVAISDRDIVDDVALAIIASPTYDIQQIVEYMSAIHEAIPTSKVLPDELGAYLSPTMRVLFDPPYNVDEACKV